MDFQEYSKLALISCKKFGNFREDMEHGLIGLVTETGELADTVKRHVIYEKELDIVNLKEEIGDLLWYFNLVVDECKYDLDQIFVSAVSMNESNELKTLIFNMTRAIGDLLINFEHDNRRTMLHLCLFASYIISFCSEMDFDIEEIMEQNIAKLKKRYPQGYTNQDALERKDKQDGTGNTEQSQDSA